MRTLLAVALLLMLGVVCVDAAETIGLFKDVTLVSQMLDGTVLNATAAAVAAKTVTVVLQQCTVQGSGLTVSCAATSNTAGSTAIALLILDTNVKNATLAFNGYLPAGSDVRIVNVDATMTSTTPLFDLQNFYLTAGSGSYMTIQRVRATWGTGDGGSVVQIGGSKYFGSPSGKVFSFSEAVVTGAAHVLEITPACTTFGCFTTEGGLNALDLVEFRDARGAFIHTNAKQAAISCSNYGMVRFSNITMTGGQPFLSTEGDAAVSVYNTGNGNVVFSAISSDGPLFSFTTLLGLCAARTNVKYTFRHINIPSVMSTDNSDRQSTPSACDTAAPSTWYFYMGNITVAGTLVNTIDDLDTQKLLATQLVDAYGAVMSSRGGIYPTATVGSASTVNCVTGRDANAAFVPLTDGVQRAECNCDTAYYPPYCTTAVDPLVYYDAYSPSPATCGVASCDTCLFGQTSQCGACSTGYRLTAPLGCDRIPCSTPNCSDCTTDDVCVSCGDGYSLSSDKTVCYTCSIPNCNSCSADGVCDSCVAGYSLSDLESACLSCHIPNCSRCTADDVCGSCEKGYKLNDKGVCKKNGVGWWVWVIVGIAAAAVVAGVIVLVVCCVRRGRRETAESSRDAYAKSTTSGRHDDADSTLVAQGQSCVDTVQSTQGPTTAAYRWTLNTHDYAVMPTGQGSHVYVANPLNIDTR